MNIMNNKGFTYTGILINLLVSLILLPIIVSCLKLLVRIDLNKMDIQNEIGLMQLRRDMLLAYDVECDLNSLDFIFKNTENSLVFSNGHLYRTPGTVIYLEGIDYAVFEEKNDRIYLIYYLDDYEYKRIIY